MTDVIASTVITKVRQRLNLHKGFILCHYTVLMYQIIIIICVIIQKPWKRQGGPTIDKKSGKTMAPLWPHAMLSPSIVKYMLKART